MEHYPSHRRPRKRTPAAASVHASMHANGGKGLVAGTGEKVGAGIGVGVMVGDMSPNPFSMLEYQLCVKGGEPIALLRTSRVSHTMGLPSHFLPAPDSYSLPKST